MNFEFPKSNRLLKRKEYETVAKSCYKRAGQVIFMDIRLQPPSIPSKSRLGITVTKKYGKAHDRNRFKRMVRESYRLLKPYLNSSIDIVVRPKGKYSLAANALRMQDILSDMKDLLREHIQTKS